MSACSVGFHPAPSQSDIGQSSSFQPRQEASCLTTSLSPRPLQPETHSKLNSAHRRHLTRAPLRPAESCQGSFVIILLESTRDASSRQTLPSTQLHAAPIMASTSMVTSSALAMRAPIPCRRSTSSGETALIRSISTNESSGVSCWHRETQLREHLLLRIWQLKSTSRSCCERGALAS